MKLLAKLCTGILILGLTACTAPEPGSEIYDGDETETEREGMETEQEPTTKTEQDATMEDKYHDGSDEDPIADSLNKP